MIIGQGSRNLEHSATCIKEIGDDINLILEHMKPLEDAIKQSSEYTESYQNVLKESMEYMESSEESLTQYT